MRVLVLGGTGRVGRLVVDEAVRRGHAVTCLVRDRRKRDDVAASVTVVEGDALDSSAVARALEGQEAVIYTLGAGRVRTTTLFSDSTRILLDTMERLGVARLVCLTGVGAGDTKGHGGFLYDRIFFPLFTKRIYEDKDRQEELIRRSRIEWSIVRAASFVTPRGPLRVETNLDGVTLRAISPSEVARFLVDELETARYLRRPVFIGHE